MKFKKNNVPATFAVIFTSIGLILAAIGIGGGISKHKFNSSTPETTAVITRIERYGDDDHRVMIKYTVEGSEYKTELGYYSSGMHEGKKVKLHYDPDDPYKFKTTSYFTDILLTSMGGLFAAIGTGFGVSSVRKKKKMKFLTTYGDRIYAVVTNVFADTSTTVNGRHPVKLICQYTDQYTGQVCEAVSESAFNDLYQFIGMPVDVYVDPADPSSTYVDIKPLVEGRDYMKIG